jgi:hypothetical protein
MTMTDTRTTARRAPEPIEQVRPARYIPVAARRAVVTEYRRFRANHAPRQAMRHIHTHYSLDVADRLASAGEVYGAPSTGTGLRASTCSGSTASSSSGPADVRRAKSRGARRSLRQH